VNIDSEVLDILKQGELSNDYYYLPQIQLDRSLYVKVNQVLECAGYKWNKKEKAHLPIQDNSFDRLNTALQTGIIIDSKKEYQFFPTPDNVIEQLIESIPFDNGKRILEPSAGAGAIADKIKKHCDNYRISYQLDVCEINPQCQQVLKAKGYNLVAEDFLKYNPKDKYDIIIMNPPFNKQQDIDHVTHALSMLVPDGYLVSVMLPSFQYRENKKSKAFRDLINNYHNPDLYGNEIREVEAGAFKKSGTNIATTILYMYP